MHLVVLTFIGVRSYKHIYCATKLVFPYVDFSFVIHIARSRTM